jgi:hypothetical protein
MIPAPLPVALHSGDVMIDLGTVSAVAIDVTVDSRAIIFHFFVAVVSLCNACRSESQSTSECTA